MIPGETKIKPKANEYNKRAMTKMSSKERKAYQKLHNSCNHIEGKFGQGKNGYELNEIKAKYANTSASWIAAVYFVMNILVFAGSSFLSFFVGYITHCGLLPMKKRTTAVIMVQKYPAAIAINNRWEIK